MILVPALFISQFKDFFKLSTGTTEFRIIPHHHVKRADTYIENRNNRPCNQVDQHLGNETKEEVDKWYDIIEDQSMMNSMT